MVRWRGASRKERRGVLRVECQEDEGRDWAMGLLGTALLGLRQAEETHGPLGLFTPNSVALMIWALRRGKRLGTTQEEYGSWCGLPRRA